MDGHCVWESQFWFVDQRAYGSDFHAIFTQSGSIFRHFSMVPSTYILDSSDL